MFALMKQQIAIAGSLLSSKANDEDKRRKHFSMTYTIMQVLASDSKAEEI